MLTVIFDTNSENIIDSTIKLILNDGYKPLAGSDDIDFKVKVIKTYINVLKEYHNKRNFYQIEDIIKMLNEDKFNKNKVITASSIISSSVYKPYTNIEIQHYLTFNFIK